MATAATGPPSRTGSHSPSTVLASSDFFFFNNFIDIYHRWWSFHCNDLLQSRLSSLLSSLLSSQWPKLGLVLASSDALPINLSLMVVSLQWFTSKSTFKSTMKSVTKVGTRFSFFFDTIPTILLTFVIADDHFTAMIDFKSTLKSTTKSTRWDSLQELDYISMDQSSGWASSVDLTSSHWPIQSNPISW